VSRYPEHCTVADGVEAFEQAVVRALEQDSPERRRQRSDSMRGESWQERVRVVGEHVMEAQQRKWQHKQAFASASSAPG
jgi:predicted proteasome-type protease